MMCAGLKRSWARSDRARGFTLIEVMIVVAVVAILAAIAYPNFQDAVRKSKRGQAKADMVDLAQRAERFHTVNNTYVGFWNTVNGGKAVMSPSTGTAAYSIAFSSPAGQAQRAFTLTATPQGTQARDVRCMTLTLTQSGKKDIVGGTGSVSDCW